MGSVVVCTAVRHSCIKLVVLQLFASAKTVVIVR